MRVKCLAESTFGAGTSAPLIARASVVVATGVHASERAQRGVERRQEDVLRAIGADVRQVSETRQEMDDFARDLRRKVAAWESGRGWRKRQERLDWS